MQHLGVGVIPWSPIARGLVTRPWGTSTKRSEADAWGGLYSGSTCAQDIVGRVEAIAKKKGVKMAQIAIAWSLTKVTAPIVGTTKLENLKEMIGNYRQTLSAPIYPWLLMPDSGV
jgi:aryl-alcohol dehydrogenase-like predicted oxidoreductase